MPPSYKPQSVAIPAGVIGESFNNSGTDFEKALAVAQALEAQGLNNDSVEISVAERQRKADEDKQLRDALIAKFGVKQQDVAPPIVAPMDPTTGTPMDPAQAQAPQTPQAEPQNFDPIEGYKLAQQIAMQQGNLSAAAEASRAQKALQGGSQDRLLTDVEAMQLDVPPGTPLSVANSMLRARGIEGIQSRFDDPSLAKARDLNVTLKNQRATGTQFQNIGGPELTKIQSSEGALVSVGEVNGLVEQLDPGALSALKAGKVTELYKDPGEPAYRMYATLDLLKKQVARMNDSGALTQLDVDMFAPLTVGSPIYDSQESLKQRMDDLARYIAKKKEIIISTNERAFRNMDRFKDPAWQNGQPAPDAAPDVAGAVERGAGTAQVAGSGKLPRNPDGSVLTREQFMALRQGGQ